MTMAELRHLTWAAATTWMMQQSLEQKALFSSCWRSEVAAVH